MLASCRSSGRAAGFPGAARSRFQLDPPRRPTPPGELAMFADLFVFWGEWFQTFASWRNKTSKHPCSTNKVKMTVGGLWTWEGLSDKKLYIYMWSKMFSNNATGADEKACEGGINLDHYCQDSHWVAGKEDRVASPSHARALASG